MVNPIDKMEKIAKGNPGIKYPDLPDTSDYDNYECTERAVLAERERCAKIAESQYADMGHHDYYRTAGEVIANRIRNSND